MLIIGQQAGWPFYKPGYGLETDVHPDTNIKINEFKAPEYHTTLKLAVEAHRVFYGIRTKGWDIAIGSGSLYWLKEMTTGRSVCIRHATVRCERIGRRQLQEDK